MICGYFVSGAFRRCRILKLKNDYYQPKHILQKIIDKRSLTFLANEDIYM